MHAYYSTALYERPDARKMAEKEWQGAELIFDLDADHIPGAEKMSYKDQLMEVKKEVHKLLHTFIIGMFGFREEHISLYFSGGRGYHIHVTDPRVYRLGSKERRELVDMIIGEGLDETLQFGKTQLDKKRHIRLMPMPHDGGWKGLIARGIFSLLDDIESRSEESALGFLVNCSKRYSLRDKNGRRFGKVTVKKAYIDLFSGPNGNRPIDKMRKGIFEVFSTDRYRDFFFELIRSMALVDLTGETDEPVTIDTHRLIRAPGTLHGKTGFQTMRIGLTELDSFDPLNDAVVLPEEPMTVDCLDSVEVHLRGEDISVAKGLQELPSYTAAFLIGRGQAILPKELTSIS